jgi:hypothetical protein
MSDETSMQELLSTSHWQSCFAASMNRRERRVEISRLGDKHGDKRAWGPASERPIARV